MTRFLELSCVTTERSYFISNEREAERDVKYISFFFGKPSLNSIWIIPSLSDIVLILIFIYCDRSIVSLLSKTYQQFPVLLFTGRTILLDLVVRSCKVGRKKFDRKSKEDNARAPVMRQLRHSVPCETSGKFPRNVIFFCFSTVLFYVCHIFLVVFPFCFVFRSTKGRGGRK